MTRQRGHMVSRWLDRPTGLWTPHCIHCDWIGRAGTADQAKREAQQHTLNTDPTPVSPAIRPILPTEPASQDALF